MIMHLREFVKKPSKQYLIIPYGKFLFQKYINSLEKAYMSQKKKVCSFACVSIFINTVFAKTWELALKVTSNYYTAV